MILCLTGTNPYSFDRLVREVDLKIGPDYEVIIQKGNTAYNPIYSKYFDFCNNHDMQKFLEKADLVITQGGYGSMKEAVQKNKKIIAVPRQILLNESLDDQTELVQYFEEKGYVIGCHHISKLENLVQRCLNREFVPKIFQPENSEKISAIIENYLKGKQYKEL